MRGRPDIGYDEPYGGRSKRDGLEIGMQRQGLGAGTGEDRFNPWTVLRKEEKFTCSYFSVRSDTVQFGAGLPRAYNSIRMKSIGVTIAPIDDEGCTTLVGQYPYILDCCTWELPGGGCRLDQAPMEAAKIELSEETGYRAANWLRLFDGTVAPGSNDGRTQCFVA